MAKARGKILTDVEWVTKFRDAYEAGGTKEEVAASLGVSVSGMDQRASKFRKMGVKLPKFQRSNKEHDVDGLNALLDG